MAQRYRQDNHQIISLLHPDVKKAVSPELSIDAAEIVGDFELLCKKMSEFDYSEHSTNLMDVNSRLDNFFEMTVGLSAVIDKMTKEAEQRELSHKAKLMNNARVIGELTAQLTDATETIRALRSEITQLSRQSQNTNHRIGYVYLLRADNGTYKIGRTRDPNDRIRTFSVKLPFEVEYMALIQTEDMYALEAELHGQYAEKRLNGSEFFALSDSDVKAIVALAHPDGVREAGA